MPLYFHEKTPDGFTARLVEEVLCHESTKHQLVTIVTHPLLGKTLYLNDCFQADDAFQTEYHDFMVEVVVEAGIDVKDVVILGSGPGGLAKASLTLHPRKVTGIEFDEEAFRLYEKFLPDWGCRDERVKVLFEDAFKYVHNLDSSSTDVIFWDIDADALPEDLLLGCLWEEVKHVLRPGGILVATAGFIFERSKTDPYTKFLESLQVAFPKGEVIDYPRLNWRFFCWEKSYGEI